MILVLQKANDIVNQAVRCPDFESDYSDFLIITGDRSVDDSGYLIPLDLDYYIFIDFVDFEFESFSIISKNQKELLKCILLDIE